MVELCRVFDLQRKCPYYGAPKSHFVFRVDIIWEEVSLSPPSLRGTITLMRATAECSTRLL